MLVDRTLSDVLQTSIDLLTSAIFLPIIVKSANHPQLPLPLSNTHQHHFLHLMSLWTILDIISFQLLSCSLLSTNMTPILFFRHYFQSCLNGRFTFKGYLCPPPLRTICGSHILCKKWWWLTLVPLPLNLIVPNFPALGVKKSKNERSCGMWCFPRFLSVTV